MIGAKWAERLHTGLAVEYWDHTISAGDGSYVSTTALSTAEQPVGIKGAALLGFGGVLSFDTRDNGYYPSRGTFAEVSLAIFDDVDEDIYGFTRTTLNLSHYLTLGRRGRIFAARLLGEMNTRRHGRQTPFFEFATLGGSEDLRGYSTGRFRDRDLLLLNLEYRYPIWDAKVDRNGAMDAVLFTDIGRVYDDLKDDTSSDLKVVYGGGLRVRSLESLVLRFEVAHSDEETKVFLKFDPIY